ncbi:unnamed protein product [Meganyctiphanes norvegica]|uniref:C-type lectin domain-containing protein n=1 Tax=Meganyctiphanes norvegica TaxID=48144 RepID=A0AAV2Q753_MEGNR
MGTFNGERLDNSNAECLGTTCPDGYSFIAGQCLTLSNELLGNTDAEKACKSKGGTLASVKDPQALLDYTKDNYDNYFWLGGSDEEKGVVIWKHYGGPWIESVWRWNNAKLVPADFPWAARQPDNATESEHCIMLGPDGYHDKGCDSQLPFVCEPQECPEGLGFFRISTKCYKIFLDEVRTFEDAKSLCESNNLRLAQPLQSDIYDLGYYVGKNYYEGWVWVDNPGDYRVDNHVYGAEKCLRLVTRLSQIGRINQIGVFPCENSRLLPLCEL